jgi:hypothetical protein
VFAADAELEVVPHAAALLGAISTRAPTPSTSIDMKGSFGRMPFST